ncbi:MAG: hypothetical protein O3A46_01615 [Candidatus Poribacteria bacterium]|nr:hypothetical protein [Candidatus Poribacteria bacterium]
MIYSFIVDASGAPTPRLRDGMRALAELADAANVPITWALTAEVAKANASWLNARHEARSAAPDDVILWLNVAEWSAGDGSQGDLSAEAERIVRQRETFPENIRRELAQVTGALPWARVAVAGSDTKNAALVYALEAVKFDGLWGYRWNEMSSRAQDRGCPFGFFYAGRERTNSAGAPMSTIVGVPRTMGDWSHWRRIPPEPTTKTALDFENVTMPTEIAFETTLFALEQVAASDALNEWNAVTHLVSAEGCAALTDEHTAALRAIWSRAEALKVEAKPLTAAVRVYKARFPETEPSYVLWTTPERVHDGERTPATRELFYADSRGQFVFDKDVSEPSMWHNYVSAPASSPGLTEFETPALSVFQPTRHRDQLMLEIVIDSPKACPYALFLWSDHRHLSLVETNVLDVKWVGEHGVLILLDLDPRENEFSLALTI